MSLEHEHLMIPTYLTDSCPVTHTQTHRYLEGIIKDLHKFQSSVFQCGILNARKIQMGNNANLKTYFMSG